VAELKKEGKINYLGLSECSAETLRRACKVHRIAAVQIEYSPFTLDIEDPKIGLLKACRELGVAVVAYSPLGRGFLTGRYKGPEDFDEGDFRKFAPRFSKENFPKNLELVEQIQKVARKKGVSSGQLVLAFLMAQGACLVSLPSFSLSLFFPPPFRASVSRSDYFV
jgi:aryl-alcohol dehydrogenase-like predicted oxidoreductase